MTKPLRSLKWKNGQINPSGIRSMLFYADKDDIISFPTIQKEGIDVASEVTYKGDFELEAEKHFVQLYTTQGMGNLSLELLGEKDGKMVNNKGLFSYPDLNDEAIAFVNRNMNSNGIIVAAYYSNGGEVTWVVLGGRDFDIELTPKGETGSKAGDKKSLEIEVTAPDFYALPRYKGLIKLVDGTYNCETNTFTEKGEI